MVTLGLNSIDLVAVVAEYPASNTKQRLQRFARLPGGQMATASAVCARLGWRASYIGVFGDDDLGRLSRDSLTREGVDVHASWNAAGATNQFAVVLVDARSGNRTVLWDRHPALSMDPSAVSRAAIESGRLLIVDCQETAAATVAAHYARAAGIPTIIDVERVRPGIAELLQEIDVIIAAQEFPTELTGHEDIGRALEKMASEFDAPCRLCHAGRGGEPGASRAGAKFAREPSRSIASTRPEPATRFAADLRPACCTIRKAMSRTCSPTRTPSRRSTAARSVRGGACRPRVKSSSS